MKSEIIEKLLENLLDEDRTAKAKKQKRPVVIFANNAIFFGYTDATEIIEGKSIVLTRSRHCYRYEAPKNNEAKGFSGLSEYGPAEGSKVSGERSTDYHIANVVCIADCTEEAVKKWEDSTWS